MSAKKLPGSAPGISSGQGRGESTKSSGFAIRTPSISLRKGGGTIKGIGEKFATNPVTGTGSMTVPIAQVWVVQVLNHNYLFHMIFIGYTLK